MTPCDRCKAMMAQGIMLIQVREGEQPSNNPCRTGPIAVVRDEAVERALNDAALFAHIQRVRYAFVPVDAWRAIGLPEGGDDGEFPSGK